MCVNRKRSDSIQELLSSYRFMLSVVTIKFSYLFKWLTCSFIIVIILMIIIIVYKTKIIRKEKWYEHCPAGVVEDDDVKLI